MKGQRAVILATLLLPAPAGAQLAPLRTAGTAPVPSWAVAAGPGLVAGADGLVTAHLRLGPEWVPERGFGIGVDAGWLCAAQMPTLGVVTVSPTVIYSLGLEPGTSVSLRAGYTALVGVGAPVMHAGVAFDHDLGRGRVRLEVRDQILVGSGSVHAVELTVGWVTP